jgi:hypothetical protein
MRAKLQLSQEDLTDCEGDPFGEKPLHRKRLTDRERADALAAERSVLGWLP